MMVDTLRQKHERRAKDNLALANNIIPKHLQKSPSQKKSEALRKKLNRGVIDTKDSAMDDCRDCGRYPCGHGLDTCDLRSLVQRCSKCGQKVRYRVIPEEHWDKCPVCRSRS